MPKRQVYFNVEDKIGDWTVLQSDFRIGNKIFYRCQCKCGKIGNFSAAYLRNRKKLSCITCSNKSRTKHGETVAEHRRTPEYASWIGMRQRCFNPNGPAYSEYGGRGITVCERWQGEHGFENFLADMGRKQSPEHTCDRINVNSNYEPSNCRWATKKEQMLNRRPFKMTRIEHFTDEELVSEIWRRTPEYGIGIAC